MHGERGAHYVIHAKYVWVPRLGIFLCIQASYTCKHALESLSSVIVKTLLTCVINMTSIIEGAQRQTGVVHKSSVYSAFTLNWGMCFNTTCSH